MILYLILPFVFSTSASNPTPTITPAPVVESTHSQDYPHVDINTGIPVTVLKVVDGDTIDVTFDGYTSTRIRLKCVDSPETVHPRVKLEFYGKEATEYIKNVLIGEKVYLVDEVPGEVDMYGRRLSHVYRAPEGSWVNIDLVRQGYASFPSRYSCAYRELFKKYETEAKSNHKGMWK